MKLLMPSESSLEKEKEKMWSCVGGAVSMTLEELEEGNSWSESIVWEHFSIKNNEKEIYTEASLFWVPHWHSRWVEKMSPKNLFLSMCEHLWHIWIFRKKLNLTSGRVSYTTVVEYYIHIFNYNWLNFSQILLHSCENLSKSIKLEKKILLFVSYVTPWV